MMLRWSPQSRDHLRAIRTYIARDNATAAEAVRLRIIQAVERLKQLPNLGRPGRRRSTRQLGVAGLPYIIVYRLSAGELVVLGIFHGAQER